ncbi:disulfide bond formation protein B [Dechloromonas sp. ZS-1]|uniref:disulfide bond formation protein B n=1 Tax=Dechloromonas sp. ZS-1 TaxID=3138067 RepID=UPI0031FD4699
MMFWGYPVRAWLAAFALGCLGLVGFGLYLQEAYRLAPCPLCIFQRLLYLLAAGLGLAGAVCPRAAKAVPLTLVPVALLGAGVAGYQTWMQAFPQLATECGFSDPSLIERLVDWLGMQYPALFLATGFCTSREWEWLGLSMANWSFILFAGILGFGLLLARARRS